MTNLYRILKKLLFLLDPEFVHDRFTDLGELMGSNKLGRWILNKVYGYNGPDISKVVDGITYKTPVILSAGFDYNGRLSQALPSLGFGGEEIGSVTAQPCAGNSKPRLKRLVKSQSIVVYKGLRNEGVDKILNRLKLRKHLFVNGISIAKTNSAATADLQTGIDDYFQSLQKCVAQDMGDYYTINISCPNAFGGEDFAEPTRLKKLLDKLTTVKTHKPIYIKLPINKSWDDLKKLLDVIAKYRQIKGVVIGNLNKDYASVKFPEEAPAAYRGGLSGKPCFELSNQLIAKTRETYKDRFTIIGCGGILTPDDALTKLAAGADLLQLITGMIFTGPQLIKDIDWAVAKNAGV